MAVLARSPFIKGRVEEAKLPMVDFIVSEWMGCYLLSEIVLDCLVRARDKYLMLGGLMFPDKILLCNAGIEDTKTRSEKPDRKHCIAVIVRLTESHTDSLLLSSGRREQRSQP